MICYQCSGLGKDWILIEGHPGHDHGCQCNEGYPVYKTISCSLCNRTGKINLIQSLPHILASIGSFIFVFIFVLIHIFLFSSLLFSSFSH